MKNGLTELVFILDKSGSMGGLEEDTIGGYNAMLRKQKVLNGECRITTVLFDHDFELLHDRIDLQAMQELTEKDYQVGGVTALLDANMNAIETAASYGITANRAVDYLADSTGTRTNFDVMEEAICTLRKDGKIRESCFDRIRKDVRERGSRSQGPWLAGLATYRSTL